jgi:hypothetical protein
MSSTHEWLDHVELVRNLHTPGERGALYKRVREGELVALCRGAYLSAKMWSTLDADARHRALVKAVAALEPADTVFSHTSAAALWRLPRVGAWPARVHALDAVATGGRSSSRLVRHGVGIPSEVEQIDGLTVSSPGRTVLDIARTEPFPTALVVADAALRRSTHPYADVPRTQLTRAHLVELLAEVPMRHGTARAGRVIEHADGSADRPGESLSRASMLTARITLPELQVPLVGASSRRYWVDFFWREFNMIGEFDGKEKYRNPQFLRGRTPEQALIDEKEREDDLRAAGHGMTRWGWATAMSPLKLAAHLARAGVR